MMRIQQLLTAILSATIIPLAAAEVVISGKGSTFVMTYDPIYPNAMQSVMNDAAQFWADSVKSDVPIHVQVNADNLNCSFSYSSHVDTKPPASVMNFANAPLANTHYPIALANSLAGVDLDPNAADIIIRFNRKLVTNNACQKWYLGYDGNVSFIQFSLYFETMQEIAHGLGLIPLGDLMTGEKLNGYNDIYWTMLKSSKQNKFITELSDSQVEVASHTSLDLVFAGEKTWEASQHLTFGRESNGLYTFARSYDADKLTGFHLQEGTSPAQLMMVDLRGHIPETDLAVTMLEDLGWQSTRNAAPVIEGQQALAITEDSELAVSLTQLVITDDTLDNLALSVGTGSNYTRQGLTVIPTENFAGTLSVPVTVNDGEFVSNTFALQVDVSPVNDAPVIDGQQMLSTPEDTALSLTAAHVTVTDVDSSVFSLEVLSGDNYSVVDNTVTPSPNYSGVLSVPVRVNDGELNSNTFITAITVTPVNDAPVITSQVPVSISEETSFEISTTHLSVSDVDSSAFTVTLTAGDNYVINGQTITPVPDFNGMITVPVYVSDGTTSSAVFNFEITVLAENDAPVLLSQNAIETSEDSSLTLSTSLLNFEDIDSSSFSIVAQPGDNYDLIGNTLVPTENFFGVLSVPMQISDWDKLSNLLDVTINVTAVNDAPEITAIEPQFITEDSSLFLSESIMTIIDPDNAEFTVSINRGDFYEVAGNEIIPEQDWFGELLIGVTVDDGEASSNEFYLALTVTSVNDLPVITTELLPTAQIYRHLETTFSATDADADTLTFSSPNLPTWLTLSAEGNLSGIPTENNIGSVVFDVAVSDDQATTSTAFSITVLDDPTATDAQVTLEVERTIWATDGWVPVQINVTNAGPKASVESTLQILFSGEWTTQDNRCTVALNQCSLSVEDTIALAISVQQPLPGSVDLEAVVSHSGFETNPTNNAARVTLTFTDSSPTSPQYTVPSFGSGNVRAIAISNIQGGRWPEIMFANGPTEASTAYKFERSLFRPVLHSHLADASDSYAMVMFDIDNDGDKDWVLANGSNEGNTVYRNNGEGFFEYVQSLGSYSSRAVAYGDLDQDGDIDLVFANDEDPNTLYMNNGDGTFTLHAEFESRRTRRIFIYDFNRDGRPDILFANRGFRSRILFNRGFGHAPRMMITRAGLTLGGDVQTNQATQVIQGGGDFSFDDVPFGVEGDETTQATLADLDGDGITSDIIFANDATDTQNATLKVFTVSPDESTHLTAETDTGTVTDLSVGDYDGDGKDDLAVLRPGGALEVMTPTAGSLKTFEVMDTDGADTILMVDVDGSGQADIISANNTRESSRLDFAGEVTNEESLAGEDDSPDVVLPATPVASTKPRTDIGSGNSSKGGAGIPLIALVVLLTLRRTRR